MEIRKCVFYSKESPPSLSESDALGNRQVIMRREKAPGICITPSDTEPWLGARVIRAVCVQATKTCHGEEEAQAEQNPGQRHHPLPFPRLENRKYQKTGVGWIFPALGQKDPSLLMVLQKIITPFRGQRTSQYSLGQMTAGKEDEEKTQRSRLGFPLSC